MSDIPKGTEKTALWRLLKSAFLKARENVRRREGAALRVRSPEHFAIDVLNEHYDKRRTAKPRDYTPAELDHALTLAQSKGFISALERAISEALLSRTKPADQPEHSGRAEPSVPSADETLEAPAASEPRELHRLRMDIERAGGEVRELKRLGGDLYAFEVATPLAVYWGKDTREEILRQVDRDVSAVRSDSAGDHPGR